MDELITKPLKRFIANSKIYAKHQIGGFYGYTKEDSYGMTDIKVTLNSPKVKYVNNYINSEMEKSNDSAHVFFNDSFINNTNDVSGIYSLNNNEESPNNNNIELVTVKILESPQATVSVLKYPNLNNMPELEETPILTTDLDESFKNELILKTEPTELKDPINQVKAKKSVIKVKVIVPKGSLCNKQQSHNGNKHLIDCEQNTGSPNGINLEVNTDNQLLNDCKLNDKLQFKNNIEISNKDCETKNDNITLNSDKQYLNGCKINCEPKNAINPKSNPNKNDLIDSKPNDWPKNGINLALNLSNQVTSPKPKTGNNFNLNSDNQPSVYYTSNTEQKSTINLAPNSIQELLRPLKPNSETKNEINTSINSNKQLRDNCKQNGEHLNDNNLALNVNNSILIHFDQNDPINDSTLMINTGSKLLTNSEQNIVQENGIGIPKCIFKDNLSCPLSPIAMDNSENIIAHREFVFPEDVNVQKNCIFEDNKSRPLSPIRIETEIFPNVEKIVNFHEKQLDFNSGSFPRHSVPIMGKAALLAKVQASKDKQTFNDSQLISTLVRDRFVINTFESRTCHRSIKKPSRYGRIYRSLERKMQTERTPERKDIIHVQQSSPIKLGDKVSRPNISQPIEVNEHEGRKRLSITAPVIHPEYSRESSYAISEEEEIPETHFHADVSRSSSESVIPLGSSEVSNMTDFPSSTDLLDIPEIIEEASFNGDKTPVEEPKFMRTFCTRKEVERPISEDVENTAQTESSYDMDEFLKKALGDELSETGSMSTNTTIQEEPKPAPRKIHPEDSICTSDASDLISKITTFQSSLYRSLTKKLRDMSHTLKSPSSTKEDVLPEDDLSSLLPNNELVTELVRQAAVQYEAMKQISKALTLCRNTKEFASSTEQVEGERLLLIAIHKRQALLNEIRRLDYEMEENLSPSIETGTVTITGINFPLKNVSENGQINRREQRHWYVCIASQGARVLSTQSVAAGEDGIVSFPEEMTFSDLPTDFAITIELFSLIQRRSTRNFSHESKFHLNKESKTSHCPTPKSFLHKDKHTQKMLARYDTGIQATSYKPNGSIKLRVADVSKSGPWPLRKVPLSSNLYGTIKMHIKTQVKIPIKHSGFLTVGIKSGDSTAWNRRWCVLNTHLIYFWNYPCDEDEIDPLEIVDLKKCINARIEAVDRSICPKPRTLLLETVRNRSEFDRYLFSADTISEMRNWDNQLNKVISALMTWNDSCLK